MKQRVEIELVLGVILLKVAVSIDGLLVLATLPVGVGDSEHREPGEVGVGVLAADAGEALDSFGEEPISEVFHGVVVKCLGLVFWFGLGGASDGASVQEGQRDEDSEEPGEEGGAFVHSGGGIASEVRRFKPLASSIYLGYVSRSDDPCPQWILLRCHPSCRN